MVISTIFKYAIPASALIYGMNHRSNVFRPEPLTGISDKSTTFLLDNTVNISNLEELINRRYTTREAQNLRIETDSICEAGKRRELKAAKSVQEFVDQLNIDAVFCSLVFFLYRMAASGHLFSYV